MFNPLIFSGITGNGGVPRVADATARLAMVPFAGLVVIQLDNDTLYEYSPNSSSWVAISSSTTISTVGAFNNTSTANGLSITAGAISLHAADGTNPGAVTTGIQTFAGVKTFSSTITGSISGNAATVTTNANLTGPITSAGNATSVASQTGTGSKFVMDTTPTLVTPILGVATATSINKMSITAPATSSTLAVADGKTATISNTLTLTGTDSSSVAFGTGGTVAYTSNKLSVFAATTSAELAGVISDETGSGALVFGTSPTFTTSIITPQINAASALVFGTNGSTTALTLSSAQVATFVNGVAISATTNQLVLGTTNTVTITSPAPAASRTYTIPDTAANSSFVMTDLAQTINDAKTFTEAPILSKASNQLVIGASGHQVTINASASVTSFTMSLPTAIATFNNAAVVSDTSGNLSYIRAVASSVNDITQTTATLANSQAAAANVTGLSFANASTQAFDALVYVTIVRSSGGNLKAVYKLTGVQLDADWSMSFSRAAGDDAQLTFSITTAGQVQYTTPTYANFTSASCLFRAITISA